MRPLAIIGLLLILLGIAGLVVGHFSITTERKVVDLGPLTASVDERHNIYVPDIAGVVAVAAGLIVVVTSRRRL
jgi:xanthosine utilization system XapX-like protein